MKFRLVALLGAVVLAVTAGVPASGSYDSPRQYYSSWYHSPQHSYYYRDYYYKPSSDYAGYKHNYVVYDSSHPKYYYYYNPYHHTYWGRCPVECDGTPQYSELAPEDRKGSLADIPEKAFPPMGDMPPVPDSTDKVKMDLPPDNPPAPNSAPVPSAAPVPAPAPGM